MDRLIRRTTGEILYNVNRCEYPNRLGHDFGGSVAYIGQTADGRQVEIPAAERGRWIDGYAVGDEWPTLGVILAMKQVSKNVIEATFDRGNGKTYTTEIDGRIVESEA